MELMRGFATVDATSVFRSRASGEDAYSSLDGLTLSTIGLGTFLGDATEEVDALYEQALDEADDIDTSRISVLNVSGVANAPSEVGSTISDRFDCRAYFVDGTLAHTLVVFDHAH